MIYLLDSLSHSKLSEEDLRGDRLELQTLTVLLVITSRYSSPTMMREQRKSKKLKSTAAHFTKMMAQVKTINSMMNGMGLA